MRNLILPFVFVFSCFSQAQTTKTIVCNKDAWVYSSVPNNNYSTQYYQHAYYYNGVTIRTFAEFDLSVVPKGSYIQSATLSFTRYTYYGDTDLEINMVSGSWTESGITWANQPTTIQGAGIVVPIVSQPDYDFNVTSQVDKWINKGYPNFGFQVKVDDESGTRKKGVAFSSSERGPLYFPTLEVVYFEPIAINGTVVPCSEGNDDGAITPIITGGNGSYTYQWYDGSGSPMGTTSNLTNISDGFYMLHVTDGNGMKESQMFLVTEDCLSETYSLEFDDSFISDLLLDTRFMYNQNTNTNNLGHGRYQYYNFMTQTYDEHLYTSLIDLSVIGLDGNELSDVKFLVKNSSYTGTNSSNVLLKRIVSDWNEVYFTASHYFNLGLPQTSTNTSHDRTIAGIENGYNYFDLTQDFEFFKSTMDQMKGYQFHETGSFPYWHGYYFYGSGNSSSPPKLEITIGNYCTPPFAELHQEIVPGYLYINPNENKLRVHYEEEYMPKDASLKYSIVNLDNDQEYTNVSYPIDIDFGNNWIEFDLGSGGLNLTSNGSYYLLEITNDKKEKRYLRFKY